MSGLNMHRAFWLLAIVLALFFMSDTCFHSIHKEQATVYVFEDRDRDGKMDRGEAPIPDTLVVGEFNIHGSLRRFGALTDEEGKAVIDAEYTHFFKIIVIPPCGAQATTPTTLDTTEEKRLRFGFALTGKPLGQASVRFRLWEDRDGDEIQGDGEGPLGGFLLYVDPMGESPSHSTLYFGILGMQTDSDGIVTMNLGNACGELLVPPLYRWRFTYAVPEPIESEDGLRFPYQQGLADITLGLMAIPTPTPAPTWTPDQSN